MEWIGIEIHPETPPEGRPLAELFPAADIARMSKHLGSMGAPYGITFSDLSVLRNSRAAHLAAEFAREQSVFGQLHAALFSAYFSQGLDISDHDVLGQLGKDAGLDDAELLRSVRQEAYAHRLQQAHEEAQALGVSGVPTVFIGDKERIVGAQPIEGFRKALKHR